MGKFDVAIIGSGPIGSTLAYNLSKEGFSVGLFDKKRNIGSPLQCAGIVDKDIKNLNDLPSKFIFNTVKGANIFAPNCENLKVSKDYDTAYVLDRVNYDKFLLKRAVSNGVKFHRPFKAVGINSKKSYVKFKNRENVYAKVIVGCDGPFSLISQFLNNNTLKSSKSLNDNSFQYNDNKYFFASQYIIETKEDIDSNFVNLFLKGKISPGFIWAIPFSKNKIRVGLFSNHSFKKEQLILNDFLKSQNIFKVNKILDKNFGFIPVYNFNKSIAKDNLILVGDAASQVKPTSGGGLNLGFKAVNIAKEAISLFLEDPLNNPLENYQKTFKNNFNNEIKLQMNLHKTFALLNKDEDFNYIISDLKEKNAEKVISNYGEIDKQSKLIKEAIKRGWFFSSVPKIFLSRISNLWNI